MESEFEPTVRMEETPEARIVEIDLPGFKREDLRVQINNQGNLVISGERVAKEMEERTKIGGRSEKMQRGGQRFRKVMGVPQNLNFHGITAKFGDGKLRVSLPLIHVPGQQSQVALPGSGKADQSLESNVDRSSPAGQQDSRKESVAPAQEDHSGRDLEAIRQREDKEKPTVAAEKSNKLLQEKKTEEPQQAEEFVAGELPTSTHAQTVSEETASAQPSESIQLKWKPDLERQPQENGGPKPEIRRRLPEKKEKGGNAGDGKPIERDHRVVGKEGNGDGIGCIVEGYIREKQEEKKDDEKCSSWRSDTFPDVKRIPFPLNSSTSTFSKRGVLIASTVVVVSVGLYITYKSRSRHHM